MNCCFAECRHDHLHIVKGTVRSTYKYVKAVFHRFSLSSPLSLLNQIKCYFPQPVQFHLIRGLQRLLLLV